MQPLWTARRRAARITEQPLWAKQPASARQRLEGRAIAAQPHAPRKRKTAALRCGHAGGGKTGMRPGPIPHRFTAIKACSNKIEHKARLSCGDAHLIASCLGFRRLSLDRADCETCAHAANAEWDWTRGELRTRRPNELPRHAAPVY